MRKRLVLVSAFVLLLMGSFVTSTLAANFSQGFEVNQLGWLTYLFGGGLVREPSGYNSVTSSEGSYHAVLIPSLFSPSVGPFTGKRFGPYTEWGGRDAFPAGYYTTSVDVYLDMALATGEAKSFNYTSSVDGNTFDEEARRDFVFYVGTPVGVANKWQISVGNALPGEPVGGVSPILVDQTGWYTFKHTFYRGVGNVLKVQMEVVRNNSSVGKWILSNPTDIIGDTVTRGRWGWFATLDFPELPIDDSRKTESSTPFVPLTDTDCRDNWWTSYSSPSFKSQGDCLSYVQANINAEGNRKDNQ